MKREIRDYRDLDVYRIAEQIVLLTYDVARKLPDTERHGLVTQMQRSAVSITSNIAEGYGRGKTGEYRHFLRIARAAACELESQLELCDKLGYAVTVQPVLVQLKGWHRLAHGLLRSLDE